MDESERNAAKDILCSKGAFFDLKNGEKTTNESKNNEAIPPTK
jgi:hypothetical protein